MGSHSLLSPSSADRVAICPGSVGLSLQMPDPGHTIESAEGTAAHAVHEWALKNEKDADDFPFDFVIVQGNGDRIAYFTSEPDAEEIPEGDFLFEIDAEMRGHVQESIDRIRDYAADAEFQYGEPATILAEKRVSISRYTPIPDQGGTCDAAVFIPGKFLKIPDVKYGRGVRVEAENNLQLALYALGMIDELIDKFGREAIPADIELAVHQPRRGHFPSVRISYADLLNMGDRYYEACKLAMTLDAPLKVSEKGCQFCKAKPVCPGYAREVERIALEGFATPDSAAPAFSFFEDPFNVSAFQARALTLADCVRAFDKRKIVKDWLTAIENHVEAAAMRGETIPGYKLVEGRSLRKWEDPEFAAVWLLPRIGEDRTWKKSLIAPAQAEKCFKLPQDKKDCKRLIVKPDGRPTLVPESDKREAIDLSRADDFENITGEVTTQETGTENP